MARATNARTATAEVVASGRSTVIRPDDDPVAADIIDAAVRVMVAKGYHGTSVRDIATEAGLAVGTLYNHYRSKQDLLVLIVNRAMDGLVIATEDALFAAGTEPADRLRAIVGTHVGRHLRGRRESLIGNSELRSLEPGALELVVSKRDAQSRLFARVVTDGVERGAFTTRTPVDTARFVLTGCTGVVTWFRPTGPLSVDEVIARHQDMALDCVGWRGTGA